MIFHEDEYNLGKVEFLIHSAPKMNKKELLKRHEQFVKDAEDHLQKWKDILKDVNEDEERDISPTRISKLHKYTDAGKQD